MAPSASVVVSLTLGVILLGLRFVVRAEERGRAAWGLAFLFMHLGALPVLGSLPEGGEAHRAVQLLGFAFFSLALVIASGLLFFDVLLVRRRLPRILRDIALALGYLVVIGVVLSRARVNLVSLLTGSVVVTAVIGLALQETLGNVMAGLSLQLQGDLEIGDWLRVDDRITGRIREVGWRATSLQTKNGDLVIVPNGVVARAMLTNFSRPARATRRWVFVRVHFRHPPTRVREVIEGPVRAVRGVLADPQADCLLWEFRDDAINYAIRFWIDDFQRDDPIDSEVRSVIWYALHRAGMEIPFPSRNVNMTEMTEDRAQKKHDEEWARRMDALARVDVFRALDGQLLFRITERMRLVIFGPGETIIRRGDPGDSLYVLRAGEVVVRAQGQGQAGSDRELAVLRPGDFFGEMSLMTGAPRSATVVARTDVECYVVARDALQEILAERPDLAVSISEILTARQSSMGGGAEQEPRERRPTDKQELLGKIASFFGLGGK